MKYLLDSNTISMLYDSQAVGHSSIKSRLESLDDEADQVFVSVLAIYEMEFGKANAPEDKAKIIQKDIQHTLKNFSLLILSIQGASLFGDLKKRLKDSRKISPDNMRKHNFDLMLASTVIVESSSLVSADSIFIELQQLESQLKIENWTI